MSSRASSHEAPGDRAYHPADAHDHPGASLYVRVAIVLAMITAIEVIIYYLPAVHGILVPTLIVLSIAKFVSVVGYFMHLKFDDRRFTWMFAAGMAISLSVFLAVMAMTFTAAYLYAGAPPAR